MTSATGLFQLLLSPLLSRSAMAFFLLLFFLCAVLFFKSRSRPTLHLVSGLLALVCLIYGLFILFLAFAFGHSDGSLTELSGEVVEWSTDGDTSLSSFVVQTEEGDRFGVLMTGQAIVLPSDTLSAEDFLRQPPEAWWSPSSAKGAADPHRPGWQNAGRFFREFRSPSSAK